MSFVQRRTITDLSDDKSLSLPETPYQPLRMRLYWFVDDRFVDHFGPAALFFSLTCHFFSHLSNWKEELGAEQTDC